MKQGVDCMTWSEACGWKASFDRAGRLCRVKEMGSTAVSLCCLDSPSCVLPHRLCPGTDLPCQATWHWPCSTLTTNQHGWPPIQPVPWSPCVHQYNQSLSWYLFKHQGWSLDVQQTVPPVCRPTMLLMTEKGDLGGLTGEPWLRRVVMPFPSSIRAPSSLVCSKAGCPWARASSLLLFPGLCVKLFCHLSVAAAAHS